MDMILGGLKIGEIGIMLTAIAVIFVGVNLLLWGLLLSYSKLPEGWLKRQVYTVLYAVDKKADEMEIQVNKQKAVYDLQLLLAWARKFVPQPVISLAIDLQLKAVRKMQESTGCPNLHDETKAGNNQTDSQSDNMRV